MAVALLLFIAAGTTLIGVGMYRYPGGTVLDPHGLEHSLWFNFLCDLTNACARNGLPNTPCQGVARAGMLCLAVALGLFWMVLPTILPGHKAMGRIIRAAGCLSAAGVIAVPFADGALHAVAIFSASVPALLAGALGFIGVLRCIRNRWLLGVAALAIVTAVIDSVLYARKIVGQTGVDSPALPLFQRLAFLFLLAWMAMVAWRVLRTHSSANSNSSANPSASPQN